MESMGISDFILKSIYTLIFKKLRILKLFVWFHLKFFPLGSEIVKDQNIFTYETSQFFLLSNLTGQKQINKNKKSQENPVEIVLSFV